MPALLKAELEVGGGDYGGGLTKVFPRIAVLG